MTPEAQKKLYSLIKKAVRDVIKEELSVILKESLSSVTSVITEKVVPTTVQFRQSDITALNEATRHKTEVPITPVKFNREKLMEMVGMNSAPTPSEDPDFAGIGDEQVNQFINKYMNI